MWDMFMGHILRAPFRQLPRRRPPRDPEIEALYFANWTTMSPHALRTRELHDAVIHAPYPAQAYRIRAFQGLHRVEDVEVLWFPKTGRAGIAWRERTYWLNAPGAKQAVRLWKRTESI